MGVEGNFEESESMSENNRSARCSALADSSRASRPRPVLKAVGASASIDWSWVVTSGSVPLDVWIGEGLLEGVIKGLVVESGVGGGADRGDGLGVVDLRGGVGRVGGGGGESERKSN